MNISRAWRDQSAASIIADGGSANYAFERYRYQTVVQLIAAIAQRVNERERADLISARCDDDPEFDPATLPAPPILADVAAVVEAAVARLYPVPDDGSAPSPRQFLVDFDIWFRLRRLTFLECLLASWQRDDGHAADFGLARGLRGELNKIYFDLRNELEDIDAGDGMSLLAGDVDAMVEFLKLLKLRLNSHDIPDHTSYTTLGDSSINARRVIAPDDRPDESSLDLRAALTEAWANYDRYDQFVLPMWSVAQGEMNQIEVVRISPFDATQLLHEGDGRAKLGGTVLGHFGAFLDEDWRRNDILWGRLDATEVILGHILRSVEHGPEADETEAPEARVRRLQQAILEEYVIPEQPIPGRPSADDLRSVLKVDANGTDGLHATAKQALDNFCTEGESTPADVAEAFYEMLHTSWTVDHESVGDRKKQKAGFVLRASRVVGRLLRYQKVNPWPDPDANGRGGQAGQGELRGQLRRLDRAQRAQGVLPRRLAEVGVGGRRGRRRRHRGVGHRPRHRLGRRCLRRGRGRPGRLRPGPRGRRHVVQPVARTPDRGRGLRPVGVGHLDERARRPARSLVHPARPPDHRRAVRRPLDQRHRAGCGPGGLIRPAPLQR